MGSCGTARLRGLADRRATPQSRLQLHFMGMAPNRTSFTVELDHKGNVAKVTSPYDWD
ncbi:hypothetical protein ACFLQU_03600 [Verrucomicrobiota bacterium]